MQDFPGGPLVETAGSIGSNPSQETKISRAQKKKKKKCCQKSPLPTKKCSLPHSIPLEIIGHKSRKMTMALKT